MGMACAIFFQGGDATLAAVMEGAQEALTLCISLGGVYMLWMGLLGIARDAGLVDKLSKKLRKPCEWMFPGVKEATGPITLNIAANMLGLGNAATPFGIEAMRIMQRYNTNKDRATDAMCVFLAVNASALQVIPSTMISLRSAAGSNTAGIIVIPSLISSAAATAVAIFLCKLIIGKRT
jgi:spore maturation protein A